MAIFKIFDEENIWPAHIIYVTVNPEYRDCPFIINVVKIKGYFEKK